MYSVDYNIKNSKTQINECPCYFQSQQGYESDKIPVSKLVTTHPTFNVNYLVYSIKVKFRNFSREKPNPNNVFKDHSEEQCRENMYTHSRALLLSQTQIHQPT